MRKEYWTSWVPVAVTILGGATAVVYGFGIKCQQLEELDARVVTLDVRVQRLEERMAKGIENIDRNLETLVRDRRRVK